MTVLEPSPSALRSPTPASRALAGVAALCVLALVGTTVGLLLDDRSITGAPAWLKPAKFAVSIGVYCATLAWVLRRVTGHRRAVAVIAWTTALALVAELVLIDLQVVRGTTSHFNGDTPFDTAVFNAMGGFVALVFLAAAGAAVLLLRQGGLTRTLAAGVRGGLLVSLLGMAEAGLMLANRTAAAAGGAHTVGAVDGGPGLAVTGWSTVAGDLRVAHFAGLHGLQALVLLAWALHRFAPGLPDRTAARLVVVVATGYAGAVVLLAWQALRGLPLLEPDAAVVGGSLGWGAVVLAAAAAVLRRRPAPA